MGVKKKGEVYYCVVCGTKVEVLEAGSAGSGTLVCCGKEMKLVAHSS